MKTFIYRHYFLLIIICWVVTTSCNTPQQEEKSPPNIIFIMSDDHAYQAISAYGHGLNETPQIDRLAEEGAIFTRATVTNSITKRISPGNWNGLTKNREPNGGKLTIQKTRLFWMLIPRRKELPFRTKKGKGRSEFGNSTGTSRIT